jgi:5-methylcytosine-specific restriction enzyme subunit McrC
MMMTEDFENIHDLLALILAKDMTEQLKQGFYREYIEVNDDLSTIRGKINLKESFLLKMQDKLKISCSYDELSENNYMNQILKSTLIYLIYHLDVARKNKDILKKVLLYLANIDKIDFKSIRMNKVHFTRHNSTYKMLVNICFMVLNECLQTTEDGHNRLAVFNDDQKARLFEKFVLEYYRKHFPEYEPNPSEIKWDTEGNTELLPKMMSDIFLTDKRGKKLIIDTKYYNKIMLSRFDNDAKKLRSYHLYQIFSYVKNEDRDLSGNVSGLLLYAKTDEDITLNRKYLLNGSKISVRTIDLNIDFSEIKRQLDLIIEEWVNE